MIAPMLTGVVYFNLVSDFAQLLSDCSIRRVYVHSFWAKTSTKEDILYYDCHCLAGLTSFANAFKIVVNGQGLPGVSPVQSLSNRKLVGLEFRKVWKPLKGDKIRLLPGQVIDDRPPRSVWVPIDDFIAGVAPDDFPVVDYTESESGDE